MSSCTLSEYPNRPVLHCEEFEIEASSPIKATEKDFWQTTESYINTDKASTKFTGLCSNCENHKNCTFPKPEGGIWHCKEYM